MERNAGKIGVWMFGATGSIATHVLVGSLALGRRLVPRLGLVTDLSPLSDLDLCQPEDLVFGGHEIRGQRDPLVAARELASARAGLSPELVESLAEPLQSVAGEIRDGCRVGLGSWAESLGVELDRKVDPLEEMARIRSDIEAFRERHQLARVVAVNLASTEPVPTQGGEGTLEALIVEEPSPSLVFTAAAIGAGCPVLNFTPSLALEVPAVMDLAQQRAVPHCGRDGKTGETLLKSVLAPMFLARNLRVLSWESYNLLGNRDGQVLAHDDNRQSKLRGKSQGVEEILGYPLHHRVHIDYVPSLDDWKTAWNLIHFEGFLGVRMSLQFTWQGCDSTLAAPLVLDLVRLLDLAHRRGEVGPMAHLAAFFKCPPLGSPPDFPSQMESLWAYAREAAT